MSVLESRPALRWLVPVAAVVAVVGGGAAARTLSASAEPSLPERTAAQLLVDLQTARLDGLSGTVVQRADLGLPTLPAGLGQGSSDLTSLISGKHTLKVWYAGPDKARVALLGTNGESDIIRNGKDVWIWNSRENTASHRVLSDAEADGPSGGHHPGDVPKDLPSGMPSQLPTSPQEAADLALRAIDPTTEVTTGSNARVADRPAYELILRPRDKASLVGEIRLAIDGTKHVPLRVQVYPKGADTTAIEVAFTDVSFTRPDEGQFKFSPPPGAKVTEEGAEGARPDKGPDLPHPDLPHPDKGTEKGEAGAPQSTVIGTGWTMVFVTRVGTPTPSGAPDQVEQSFFGFLENLPKVSGPWGSGKVLESRLFTALLTDDGRVLAGAVSPARLAEVAGDPAAAVK